MIIAAISLSLLTILWFLYKRNIPVYGVSKFTMSEFEERKQTILVDIRDYQTSSNDPILNSIVLPLPYLKRYYEEIPRKQLILITSDNIEKNLAIRFLKRKGYQVVGYYYPRNEQKESLSYEI